MLWPEWRLNIVLFGLNWTESVTFYPSTTHCEAALICKLSQWFANTVIGNSSDYIPLGSMHGQQVSAIALADQRAGEAQLFFLHFISIFMLHRCASKSTLWATLNRDISPSLLWKASKNLVTSTQHLHNKGSGNLNTELCETPFNAPLSLILYYHCSIKHSSSQKNWWH